MTLQSDIGYGSDLSCSTDLDERCTELSGDDWRVVAQALYRRLTTPRGALLDDPSYGLDLGSMLNVGLTARGLNDAALAARCEVLKDDRVAACDVEIVQMAPGNVLEITLAITLADPSESFALVMSLVDGQLLLAAEEVAV